MGLKKSVLQGWFGRVLLLSVFMLALPVGVVGKSLSDTEVARELFKDANKTIVEEFLKYELQEVNEQVTKFLLKDYPSLIFFFKQVDRGPLKSLFFLEEWVHKLRDAQDNIDSFPYSTVFSSDEKKKIMGLRATTKEIISYGIPIMKRDFLRVANAAKELAEKRRKHPMELLPNPSFRDAIYRQCEPTAKGLAKEIGELSEGELICMRLGWVLEQVTVTSLWLKVTDNTLPDESEYMVFRKKRSEYFNKRLKRIYGDTGAG